MNKQEFLALLDKYLAGKATPEEEQLLFNFFQSFQTDSEWNEDILGQREKLGEKMLQRLQIEVGKKKKAERSLSYSWIKIAAAVILVLFTAGLFLWRNPSEKVTAVKHTRIKNDIRPGGNKAILTLADGSEIVLNDAQNGIVSKQGNTKIIKLDGRLTYNAEKTNDGKILYNTISTPRGGQYQLILPDGSKVWLNALSSLRFPTEFKGQERNVELAGEAYFEVEKNKNMPFKVSVNGGVTNEKGMQVEVLGTHFNIMAYNDEASYSTTLLEGKVKINTPQQHVLLNPGQQAGLNRNSGNVSVTPADVEQAVAWKNGYFLFNNEDIQTIMRQISRWYDVEIVYQDDINERFMGSISRFKNVSQILDILELTGTIHFKIDGRRIIVMH